MEQRSGELPEEAWREITVAESDPRVRGAICSAPSGCGQPAGGSPAKSTGAATAGTWTAVSPATICPTPPEDTPLETLAYVGGSRWRIETEFETEKSDVGPDEYETRTWARWHHHVAMCLLGGAFLLGLQQHWRGRCPGSHGPKSTGWCGKCCPGNGSGQPSCCGGWRRRRTVTNGPNAPMPSAAPPCGHHPTSLPELTL